MGEELQGSWCRGEAWRKGSPKGLGAEGVYVCVGATGLGKGLSYYHQDSELVKSGSLLCWGVPRLSLDAGIEVTLCLKALDVALD